jgi:hypothetical protein
LAYRVIAMPAVREQLRNAPPVLQGYVAACTTIDEGDFRTLVFPEGRGFLRHEVIEKDQVVFLLDRTWV